ncbi:hypothetical protein LZ30DRAFT_782754 [Colletotrichum cereale]|nr:hypothetical protein LZ30DRAFT_782754 [Colletotrichum cereale]
MQHIGTVLLSIAAVAAAVPTVNLPRASFPDKNAPFQVYAYGTGIGGLPMFSAGGEAYFGDHSKFNDPNAAPVIFTPAPDNVWHGAPNTTALNSTATPSWSNLTFSIPAEGASDHGVGLVGPDSTTPDRQTNGFTFYGSVVIVEGGSGSVESMWYATPSSIDGIYSLKWNATGDAADDKIILALKKTPPSNDDSKTKGRDV